MEFGWTEQQAALTERLDAFLAANLPPGWEDLAPLSPGSQALTDFSRAFCPKLAEAGLLVSHWPEEFGGSGASAWDHFVIGERLWEAGEPRGPQYYNVNWIGPTILAYGSDEQGDQQRRAEQRQLTGNGGELVRDLLETGDAAADRGIAGDSVLDRYDT